MMMIFNATRKHCVTSIYSLINRLASYTGQKEHGQYTAVCRDPRYAKKMVKRIAFWVDQHVGQKLTVLVCELNGR